MLKGSCLCGSVRYEIDGTLDGALNCHCSMCRKFHGAEYATFASVHRDQFHWIQGEELLKVYTAQNATRRTFCSICGSSLTFSSSNASDATVEIALGTLDGELEVKPDAHIFVGSKANWSVLCDDLPQYLEDRNSERLK